MDLQEHQHQHPQHRHTEHHKAQNFSTGGRTDGGYHQSKQSSTEDEEECYRSGPVQQGDECGVGQKYGGNRLGTDDSNNTSMQQSSGGGFGSFGGFGGSNQGQQQQQQQQPQLEQYERQEEPQQQQHHHQHQHQQQQGGFEPEGQRSSYQQEGSYQPEQRDSYDQQPQQRSSYEPQGQQRTGTQQGQAPKGFEQAEYSPEHERHTGVATQDKPDRGNGYVHKEVAHDDLSVDEPTHGTAQQEARPYSMDTAAGRNPVHDSTTSMSGAPVGAADTQASGAAGEKQVGGLMSYVPFTQAWTDTAEANRQNAE